MESRIASNLIYVIECFATRAYDQRASNTSITFRDTFFQYFSRRLSIVDKLMSLGKNMGLEVNEDDI